MNTLRKAAQQALEALSAMLTHMGMDEDDWNKPTFNQCRKAEAALRAALANGDKLSPCEPVAWMDLADDGARLAVRMFSDGSSDEVPLYLGCDYCNHSLYAAVKWRQCGEGD